MALEGGGGMLDRLDHVIVLVRDLEIAGEAYASLLGSGPQWRGTHPELGTANALFRLDNTVLELLAISGEGLLTERLAERLANEGEGLFALAFGTPDADGCAAMLRRHGLQASDPVDGEGRAQSGGQVRRWRNVYLPEDETRGVPIFAIERLDEADTPSAGETPVDQAARVEGVDHVVVLSADAEAARALYGDRLGLRLALDRSFPERGLRLLFFRLGGVTVEIAVPIASEAAPGSRDCFGGIAYRVGDVARTAARLAASHWDVSEVRSGQKPGTRVCTVRGGTHGVPTLLIGPG